MRCVDGNAEYFSRLFKRVEQIFALWARPIHTIRLLRVVVSARLTSQAGRSPNISAKFVGDYLCRGMSRNDRFDSLQHHYDFIKNRAPNIEIGNGIDLWCLLDDEGMTHSLILQPSWMAPMEGEVELCFSLQNERLFTLTFSFLSGKVIGCAEPAVIFVGGLQGAYFAQRKVRYSARKNDEIAPATVLFVAISAVAEAFGIDTIVGTSNRRQVASRKSVDGRSSSFDYDVLWKRWGGVESPSGHYHIPVVEDFTSKNDAAGSHKARTRRRRTKRAEIRACILRKAAAILSGDVEGSLPETAPGGAVNVRPISATLGQ